MSKTNAILDEESNIVEIFYCTVGRGIQQEHCVNSHLWIVMTDVGGLVIRWVTQLNHINGLVAVGMVHPSLAKQGVMGLE